MRIALFSEHPERAGGVARYTVPVAEALAMQGHLVDYLWTGGYAGLYDWRMRPRWEDLERHRVRYHGLVNAKSIGIHAGKPHLDVTTSDVQPLAERASALRPDVIHVHSVLGLPLSTLESFARIAPVVLSCHEFSLICQRRVLVQRGGNTCTTFASQRDCPSCVDGVSPVKYRLRSRLENTPKKVGIRAVHAFERGTSMSLSVEALGEAARPVQSTEVRHEPPNRGGRDRRGV